MRCNFIIHLPLDTNFEFVACRMLSIPGLYVGRLENGLLEKTILEQRRFMEP